MFRRKTLKARKTMKMMNTHKKTEMIKMRRMRKKRERLKTKETRKKRMARIKRTKKTRKTISQANPRQGKPKKKSLAFVLFCKQNRPKKQVIVGGYLNLTLCAIVNENLDF